MIHLTLQQLGLQNPTWSAAALKPGEEVTLKVDAEMLTASEVIRFDIWRNLELVDVVESEAGKPTAKWTPPNLPDTSTLLFKAYRFATPGTANGQTAVAATVNSPNIQLRGYKVAQNTVDAAFVPKQEKLQVGYTVTDAGAAAKKGRYEIWGERYPGDKAAPLYTEDFTPAAGAKTWSGWNGKANAGVLSGKYITPEFSPYKVRVIIGPDSASVKDPDGAGQGKVAIAEAAFEVSVFSVQIRLQDKVKETTKIDEYKLEEALVIAPRQPDGSYAATGRLPTSAETGLIRVPCARHFATGEAMSQGGNNVANNYVVAGAVKPALDVARYSRPELPLEFEPRLKSRDNTVNTDVKKRGLFEKEAVGALQIEPVAEDFYDTARFPPTGGGLSTEQQYLINAACKIKQGIHNAPQHVPTNPVQIPPAFVPGFQYWQAWFEVAADNDRDFNIATFNGTGDCHYTPGANELKVYLNRGLLTLSTAANDTEIDAGLKDYREIGAAPATSIRLGPHLTLQGDQIWVVRTDPGGPVVGWDLFPPGPNCHTHYNGQRAKEPSADLSCYFRRAYSPDPAAPFRPIVGKASGTYPYTDYINLRPDLNMDQNRQERVSMSALTSGAGQGLAGALFSPSCQAGDAWKLHAWVDHQPYARQFGFVQRYPKLRDSSTGKLELWRRPRINKSLRMPAVGASGLPAGVGMALDAGAYRADGVNMDFSVMNGQYAGAFLEWTTADKTPFHQNVDLKKYRKAHGLASNGKPGKVPLNSNSDVRNSFVCYDYYRQMLPPNVPPNRQILASNTVYAEPAGTSSVAVGNALVAAMAAHAGPGDAALAAGATLIPIYGGTSGNYWMTAFGVWKTIAIPVVNVLTPGDPDPEKMNVVRWQHLHEYPIWTDFAGDVVNNVGFIWEGECIPDGKSLFYASVAAPTLFAHEMGHSLHLVHFVAGNFGWKHHDLNSPGCIMSYTHTTGNIWQSGGEVGPTAGGGVAAPLGEPWPLALGATDVGHGWPHWDTNPASGNVEFCIRYGANTVLAGLCAKCLLKLGGWDDQKLPTTWTHPDLY